MTNYYVSTTGSNSNNGSVDKPWKTITFASTKVQAGDIVNIKSGNYGHEHINITNSGSLDTPITFIGYDGKVIINGHDQSGIGINIESKKHIIIKNIEITAYEYGIYVQSSSNITLDNLNINNIGNIGYNGWGILLANSDNCLVSNCTVTDARGVEIYLRKSNHNHITNCKAYGIDSTNPVHYYILIAYSYDNIMENCISENKHRDTKAHPGHGIGIKDYYYKGYKSPHSYNNLIKNCEAHGHGENFYVAHPVHDNEFINCTAYNDDLHSYIQWNVGFRIRDGAYNNSFKNCTAIETRSGAFFYDSAEAVGVGTQITFNNNFTNCIFTDVYDQGISLSNTKDNVFANCVIINSPKLFNGNNQNGNILKNSIVLNIPSIGLSDIDITYSNFWNNGFSMPSGTGNINVDPLFANLSTGDFHLKSKNGRLSNTGWICDSITSQCIDAGDPNDDYSNEPRPNGGRINIGAYGNTKEASKSYDPTSTPTPTPTPMPATPNRYLVTVQSIPPDATIIID